MAFHAPVVHTAGFHATPVPVLPIPTFPKPVPTNPGGPHDISFVSHSTPISHSSMVPTTAFQTGTSMAGIGTIF